MKLHQVPTSIFYGVILLGLLPVLFTALGLLPIRNGIHESQSPGMQSVHALGLAMYSYAQDHSDNYPDGKSSTEVFQQLVDGGYIVDTSILYIPAPGKIKAVSGQKLKPENICWDVTGGLTNHSPDKLPLIFLTGYRLSYIPDGVAVPIAKVPRTWSQWLEGEPEPSPIISTGNAIFYVNNSAKFMNRVTMPDGTSCIPHFISPDYVPDGKTYRQLTPDGVLPP